MSAAPLDRDFGRRIDCVIDAAIEEQRVVGGVILVAQRGDTLYRRGFGLADREQGKPMTEGTIFRLSSVTKPIVAVAALALVEAGRLALHDPVAKFVPEFRPRMPNGEEKVITVRQLLTHTAGLAYGFAQPTGNAYERARVSDGLDQPGLSMADNLARIASVPLAYAPGTRWAYSVAIDVLGEIMARAAGVSLPDLVDRLVVEPLGMSDSGFGVRDENRLATPYADDPSGPVRMGEHHLVPFGDGLISLAPARTFDPASFASGGAGMNGTAADVLTFLETIRTGGGAVVRPETTRAMTADAIAGIETTRAGWGWGLGFAVLRDPAAAQTPQARGTWRWGGVYGHSWFVDPTRDLTVVLLTNTAIAGMAGAFPDAVRDAIYGV
ncbi:CubicO group peptidase, beta-lactamase class C family [Mesorhizobium sp. NFR06]|uniref:serine hydrolase domain-containing protein n=1 Tax=Mesorhizobium sp. NFR06 TaxID=1566290 RepID=UPI0008F40ED7|nr:serine hydrolase domain-containing protein [Mesorhizobium sp. NFR06]SFP56477.1 CubicO group peptidase, beta-lactamase class C family [Mesorhizobium sp. NFR06]